MARTKEELTTIINNINIRFHKEFGDKLDPSRLEKWLEETLKARTDSFLRTAIGNWGGDDLRNLHQVVITPEPPPGPIFPPPTRAPRQKKGKK